MKVQKACAKLGFSNQPTVLPPARSIHASVRPVYRLKAVEMVRGPAQAGALWQEKRRVAIGTTSAGEKGCADGLSSIDGYVGI